MKQTELLEHLDRFIKGNITIREVLAKTAEYCDYHNDKLNDANRLVFDLTAENGTLLNENEQLKELYKASVQTINEMDVEISTIKKFVTEVSEAYKKSIDNGFVPDSTGEYFIEFAEKLLNKDNPLRIEITIKTAFGNPYQESVLYMADIIESVVKKFGVIGDDLVINEKFGKYYTTYKGNLGALASRRFAEGEWVTVSDMGGAV